jgi:hypothetical protein
VAEHVALVTKLGRKMSCCQVVRLLSCWSHGETQAPPVQALCKRRGLGLSSTSRGPPDRISQDHNLPDGRYDLLPQLHTLAFQIAVGHRQACDVSAGPGQALDEPVADWICAHGKNDRRFCSGCHECLHRFRGGGEDDIEIASSELRRQFPHAVGAAFNPEIFDLYVAALDQSVFMQPLFKCPNTPGVDS